MIRIRYENTGSSFIEPVDGYEYRIKDGEFQFFCRIWAEQDEPPMTVLLCNGMNLDSCEKTWLELETSRWTRKYSFSESSTVLMTAMSDYETEMNIETVTDNIEW